jgi:hypothetical protein
MSMVDFRPTEYSGKTVADGEIKKRVAQLGVRKTARNENQSW